MTFTEAAAQVLRLVGKPLHYKEITDVAIEKDLLSHVGKSPEVTMGARLAAMVKKGDKDNPLIRVKPGVFALQDWDESTITKGLADRTPALDRLAQLEQASDSEPAEETSSTDVPPPPERSESMLPPPEERENSDMGEDEKARAELAASATEIFAAEDDDDEPILGSGAEVSDDDDDDDDDDRDGGKRRRRGRRKRRGSEREERNGLPGYTVTDASNVDVDEVLQSDAEQKPARRGRDRGDRNERSDRGDRNERGDRGDRDRDRGDRSERESRRRGRDRGDRDRDRGDRGDRNRAPLADGGSLADFLEGALSGFQRQGGAQLRQLVDEAQKKNLVDGPQAQSAVMAALRADNLRRSAKAERPRFNLGGNKIGLTEWSLDSDCQRLERELLGTLKRYREALERNWLKKLSDLPHRSLGDVILVLLERLSYSGFEAVRRPGTPSGELHYSAKHKSPLGTSGVAIVIRRDGRDVGREQVTELRGSLHHYEGASQALIITTGQVLSGARDEAVATGATPVSLIDGTTLARLADDYGVGVTHVRCNLPMPDAELFESLRSL